MNMENNKTKRFNMVVDDETHNMIESLQKDFNMNVSSLLRTLLKDYYETKAKK